MSSATTSETLDSSQSTTKTTDSKENGVEESTKITNTTEATNENSNQVRASNYVISDGKSTTTVGDGISYSITLNSNATTADPLAGVELTVQLPKGFILNQIATNPYVDTYYYDESTNQLSLKLKPIPESVINFTFDVNSVQDENKYNNMIVEASISVNDLGSGKPETQTVKTTVVGDVTYAPGKQYTTIPGTGNRTVTYSFNVSSSGNSGQFTTWRQVITDQLPAGSEIMANDGKVGNWVITGSKETGWTAERKHIPGTDLGNEKDFPSLTVYYPEDSFPSTPENPHRPPINYATLKVYDKNNQEYDGGEAHTQGPEMSEGEKEGLGIDKRTGTNQGGGSWYDGYYNRHFQIDGSFISSTNASISFLVEGSTGYGMGNKRINLSKGEYVTGTRLVIGNKEDEKIKIKSSSIATMDYYLYPSTNNHETKEETIDDSKAYNNRATISGFYDEQTKIKDAADDFDVKVKKNVMLRTQITAPTTMNVGEPAQYKAYINNQSASFDYSNSEMRVVLPAGVYYDQTKGVTPIADTSDDPYNIAVPKSGSGVVITTETVPATNDYPYERQVVVFKFLVPIPAMRVAGTATDRWIERKGLGYTIPVQVTNEAYTKNTQKAPVSSWATTTDSRFKGINFHNYEVLLHNDDFNFDAERDVIARSEGQSQIQTQGGLLLTKLVKNNTSSQQVLTKTNVSKNKAVRIEKRDSYTNELLRGAKFELLDSNGKILKTNLTTDKNGIVVIDELKEGGYSLVETKAPSGYNLDKTSLNFTVGEDTTLIKLIKFNTQKDISSNIGNSKNKSGVQSNLNTYYPKFYPKTNEKNTLWITLVGVIILQLSIVIWFMRKRK